MNKTIKRIFASFLCFIGIFVTSILTVNKTDENANYIRTFEISNGTIDEEFIFNSYDDYEMLIDNNISNFEGTKTINLFELCEVDNVDYTTLEENVTLKFSSSFNYENGESTLNAYLIEDGEHKIIDTIYGLTLLSDNGEVDVVYDFDGELIFLSELQNANQIDNVGWFKSLVKKVAKKVVDTTNATIKVLSTTNGTIGSICTLAACAGAGALCAFIPGGQIVTTVCASIAGSIVGGIGFQISAELAKKQNPAITNEDISNYSALGSFVGSCVSVASCSTMSTYREKRISNGENTISSKKYDNFNDFKKDYGTANSYKVKYGETINGKYEWHHIVEQNQIGKNNILSQDVFNIDNTISLGYDTHRKISAIYSSNIKNLSKYEISGLEKMFFGVNENQTVRSYLSTLTYAKQYDIGIEILKLLGVTL